MRLCDALCWQAFPSLGPGTTVRVSFCFDIFHPVTTGRAKVNENIKWGAPDMPDPFVIARARSQGGHIVY